MRAKYNNLWQRVLFKPPPWTLTDVLQCLLKHWIAVFNEVFPRIEQLITDLKNSLMTIENKSELFLLLNSRFQWDPSNLKSIWSMATVQLGIWIGFGEFGQTLDQIDYHFKRIPSWKVGVYGTKHYFNV